MPPTPVHDDGYLEPNVAAPVAPATPVVVQPRTNPRRHRQSLSHGPAILNLNSPTLETIENGSPITMRSLNIDPIKVRF